MFRISGDNREAMDPTPRTLAPAHVFAQASIIRRTILDSRIKSEERFLAIFSFFAFVAFIGIFILSR